MATTPVEDHHCPRCPFKTTWNCRMKNHLKSHDFPKEHTVFNCANAIESLRCFQCNKFESHNLVHLKHHRKADHALLKFEAELYNCKNCSFQTYSNYLFLTHKLFKLCREHGKIKSEPLGGAEKSQVRTENSNRFQCEYCSYRRPTSFEIKRHILVKHTDPNKIQWFECEHCPYKGKTKQNLKDHANRMHGNMEYFKCDLCPFKTKAKYSLKYHNLSKHVEGDKIQWFQCTQCPFRAKSQYFLKQHLDKKHGNAKRLKCDSCPFETLYKHVLRHHVLYKHTDREKIQWFQCGQCSYRSITKSNLTQHTNLKHSCNNRFQCELCPFKTVRRCYLREHFLRKHPEERPQKMKCLEYAPRWYETNVTATLKRHVVSKPEKIHWFQCEYCPYKYTVEAYLKRHVECNHGNEQTHNAID